MCCAGHSKPTLLLSRFKRKRSPVTRRSPERESRAMRRSPERESRAMRRSREKESRVTRRSPEKESRAMRRSREKESRVTRRSPEKESRAMRKSLEKESRAMRRSRVECLPAILIILKQGKHLEERTSPGTAPMRRDRGASAPPGSQRPGMPPLWGYMPRWLW